MTRKIKIKRNGKVMLSGSHNVSRVLKILVIRKMNKTLKDELGTTKL